MKKAHIILLLSIVILFQNCSTDNDALLNEEVVEILPIFDVNDYDTISIQNKVRMLLPNYFSLIEFDEKSILIEANHVSKEEHLSLVEMSRGKFSKSIANGEEEFKSMTLFSAFIHKELKRFRDMLKSETTFELLNKSFVNGLASESYKIEGRNYGFPLDQVFYIRFYEGKNEFYSFISWTTKKSKTKFNDVVKIMQLTLKENP